MKVSELLSVWVRHSGEDAVSIYTVGNGYGADVCWSGSMVGASISGYTDSKVIGFSVDYVDGVNMIVIQVDANTVPTYLLKGMEYLKY